MLHPSMDDRALFINRELSWLAFNERVLEEAADRRRPPLERLKFIAIFSSNLDEFFMIRVAGLKHHPPEAVASTESGDRALTGELLQGISARVHALVDRKRRLLQEEILPALAEAGLRLLPIASLKADAAKALDTRFAKDVQPALTPMVIDPAHPFPHIQNRHLYIAALLKSRGGGKLKVPRNCLAIVPVPPLLPRFLPVSAGEGAEDFVLLEDLIGNHLDRLFSGFEAHERAVFRLTRDQDIELGDQDAEDLVKAIQSKLTQRRRGLEVRLEIEAAASDRLRKELLKWLDVEEADIYPTEGPLNDAAFMAWTSLPGHAALREPVFTPEPAAPVRAHKGDLFSLIRTRDVLLHHPYESFDVVIDFLEQASRDPDVLAIKQTLYRAGRNSPVVAALAAAAQRDKEVTALIELQARFDEEANIEWARTLERAGGHVVYGLAGLKTHCKVTMIVRRDPDRIRRYVHLSTGNYNPSTARIYTDIGLFTCDDRIGEDVSALFNLMTGYAQPPRWQKLVVAPQGMREWIVSRIEREAAHKRAGRPARIIAKMNGLVDQEVIRALYGASQAGVPVDLVVRGICCLRPGVPAISETVSVRSIVGRYLEHSRILYLANGGEEETFLSSADWMPRNFDRRVEVAFPVENPALRKRLIDEILGVTLLDDAQARFLNAEGGYVRGDGAFNCHSAFEQIASGVPSEVRLPPPASGPRSAARKSS